MPSVRRLLSWHSRAAATAVATTAEAAAWEPGDPYGTYQPYIDGEMEIADINMMVAERNAKLFGLQRG